MNTTQLLYWITEREAIRLRRVAGQPAPWTDDPILREWSFCNIRREHDRVTRWIADNWRAPHADDSDLFFAMAVARLVNWPNSLAAIGYPVPWNRDGFVAALRAAAARGEKVWGEAYNISNGGKSLPKVEVVAAVLDALWARRKQLRPKEDDSLLGFYARLRDMRGFGSFMAAQVVADVKQVEPLRSARDWWSFAAPGPGSKRGLNRVLGRPVDASWSDDDAWRAALARAHEATAPELERVGVGPLCAQDLQNCLCEFDKYERVRLGEGKPKRRFVPQQQAAGEEQGVIPGKHLFETMRVVEDRNTIVNGWPAMSVALPSSVGADGLDRGADDDVVGERTGEYLGRVAMAVAAEYGLDIDDIREGFFNVVPTT